MMKSLVHKLPAHARKPWRRDLEFALKGIGTIPDDDAPGLHTH